FARLRLIDPPFIPKPDQGAPNGCDPLLFVQQVRNFSRRESRRIVLDQKQQNVSRQIPSSTLAFQDGPSRESGLRLLGLFSFKDITKRDLIQLILDLAQLLSQAHPQILQRLDSDIAVDDAQSRLLP